MLFLVLLVLSGQPGGLQLLQLLLGLRRLLFLDLLEQFRLIARLLHLGSASKAMFEAVGLYPWHGHGEVLGLHGRGVQLIA
jgi:hypothetical protein